MTRAAARVPALTFALLSLAAAAPIWIAGSPASLLRLLIDNSTAIAIAGAATTVIACAGWAAGTMTAPAAVVGTVLGVAIFVGTKWPGWTLLVLAFAVAVGATRFGHEQKRQRGIAEARGGRRGVGNAWGNVGVSALAALAAAAGATPALAYLAMVAALIAAVSDTVASEVGKAMARTAWLPTRRERVPAGTIGAISLPGTLASVACAALLGASAILLGLIAPWALPLLVFAVTVASFVEGIAGATLEQRGFIDNNGLNFFNSLLAAALTLALRAAID